MTSVHARYSDIETVVRTAAALATSGGGMVWIGLDEDGNPTQETIGTAEIEALAQAIRQHTEPPQFPTMTMLRMNGSNVVRMAVEDSQLKPVWAYNTPYRRGLESNEALSREEADRMAQDSRGHAWDQSTHLRLVMDDLHPLKIADFAERADLPEPSRPQVALENLGLLSRGHLTNAAGLLFARNVQGHVPQAVVKCARFAGNDSVDFVEQDTLRGTVLEQIDAALAFVRKHTMRRTEISGEAERREVADYPERAVREAVINAVCHRDYAMSGNVQIRIYDDRLEIWNPGELPSQIRVEDLFDEHPSLPRNASLAAALYRVRYIEQWGSGTLRMVRAAEQNGSPKPEFESEMGVFKVRFRRERLRPKAVVELQPRVRTLYDWLASRPGASIAEIVEFSGVSKSQANVDVKSLVELGLVEATGKSVSTRYRVLSEKN